MRHRAIGIEIGCFLEGANRGAVIEAVQKREALIEVPLRLRRLWW